MDIQKGKLTSDDVKAVEDEAQGDLKGFPYVLETIKEIVIAHRRKGTTEPSSLCWGGELEVAMKVAFRSPRLLFFSSYSRTF